jgi:endo-beta-N-acetylglucosaminidase D
MKYKYTLKIHNVIDYSELETVMNDYGSTGYRVTKAEFIGDTFESGRPMKKFVLYLEKKQKK